MSECKCKHCGDTNPDNFYILRGYRRKEACKNCHNKQLVESWIANKLQTIAEHGGKCQHCGYDKYHGALEFHHVDPSKKEGTPSRLWGWSKARRDKELANTILLCANCHREEHERLRNTTF